MLVGTDGWAPIIISCGDGGGLQTLVDHRLTTTDLRLLARHCSTSLVDLHLTHVPATAVSFISGLTSLTRLVINDCHVEAHVWHDSYRALIHLQHMTWLHTGSDHWPTEADDRAAYRMWIMDMSTNHQLRYIDDQPKVDAATWLEKQRPLLPVM